MKNLRIGFSPIGLLAVGFVMLPNVLSLFISAPVDALSQNQANFWLWHLLENVGRFGIMITLCAFINKNNPIKNRRVDVMAIGSLIIYYAFWGFYFSGHFNAWILVGMAIAPSIFFLLTAWKLRNPFALSFTLLFALFHSAITSSNFLF